MDYKKMYEQAIKRAKAMIPVAANQEEIYNSVITIFPELRESEDEKVRKTLIRFFEVWRKTRSHCWGVSIQKILAWLEKQKEFVSADFDDVWETADCEELTAPLEKYSKEAIKKMCHAWYDKGIELERRNWLEKQGEQKPVVIPKFRVGDFVKDANYHGEPTYEIVGMDGECYICQYRGNKSMGDRSVMHFCFDNPYLRLVEQKPVEDVNGEDYGIDSLWHAHRILEKTLGKVDGYQTDDGILEHECAISAVKKLYEQKPAWSEEDDEMVQVAINACNSYQDSLVRNDSRFDKAVKAEDWLKDLKDRVQPKQEWNEEDKKHVHSIISTIEYCRKENERSKVIADAYTSDLEWFKSLINRCKPSEDLPHWKKGTLKGKNVTGFNSDFFSHNGYYINYNELFDKLPKDD